MKITLALILLLLPVVLPAQEQQADTTMRRGGNRRMQQPEHRSHTEWHYHRGSKRVPSSNDTASAKRRGN